jgi:putative peptidoglycan lipid II flippase
MAAGGDAAPAGRSMAAGVDAAPAGRGMAAPGDGAAAGRSMATAGTLLLAAFLVTKVAGYLEKVVIAHRFGTGREMDAYVLAFTIPNFFLFLVIGGAVSSAFVPVVTERLARGREEDAVGVVNGVMTAALLILVVGVVALELAAPLLVAVVAQKLPPASRDLELNLTRIILIQPLFLGLGGFSLGVMNAYRRFRPLALAPLAYDLVMIAAALFLVRVRFHGGPLGIFGLAIGVAAAGFVHFAVQLYSLVRIGWRPLSVARLGDPGVRRVAGLTVPIALSLVAAQANIAIDNGLATNLPSGNLSALGFANDLAQIPNLTFTTALTLVVFPFLAGQAALGDLDGLRRRAALALRLNLLTLLPAATALVVLGPQIIALLLQRGAFDARSTALVYVPLALFAVGIAAQASIFLVVRVYYSLQAVMTPMLVALVAVGCNLALTLALLHPLGAGGLALATSLSSIVNLVLLIALLRPRLGGFEGLELAAMMGRAAAGCAALALVAYPAYHLLAGGGAIRLDARHYLALALALALGFGAYLAVQFALRSPEAAVALRLLTRRVSGRASAT